VRRVPRQDDRAEGYRRKRDRAHTYSSYRCGFAAKKGCAVTGPGIRDKVEAALFVRLRDAMTLPMIDGLIRLVNLEIEHIAVETASQAEDISRLNWFSSRQSPQKWLPEA
jgi:hypothetical protein